jgi:O-antigen/teichoic acid export membrane protein
MKPPRSSPGVVERQPTELTDAATQRRGELGQAALSGTAWAYASFVLSKLLVFGSTVILARLLSPADFGVVGYATAITGYLEVARDLGVGSALIARPNVDRRIASIAFQLSVGWGLLLAVAVYLGAPLLGDFYGDLRAVPVARVLSLGFLLSTLGSTHDALLYRGLAFNRRIVPDVVQALVKGVTSIGLAWAGWGYWSLVFGQLAGEASFCVVAWIMQPFRPRLEWDYLEGRWLLGFGSAVVASRLLWALLTSLSYLIVGSELGAAALGVFTLAYRLPSLALMSNYTILSAVVFPVYARLQDDLDGLRRGYLLGQRYMALILIPAGVGLAVVAPLFVSVFYGPRWAEAGPIMQIISLRCAVAAIGWHTSDLAKAVGRARLQLVLAILPVAVLVPTLVVAGRLYGLIGLASVYAAGSLISAVLRMVLVRHIVQMSVVATLRSLEPALVAALAVAATMGGFLLISSHWPDGLRLACAALLGVATYGLALLLVGRDLLALLPARFGPWSVFRMSAPG